MVGVNKKKKCSEGGGKRGETPLLRKGVGLFLCSGMIMNLIKRVFCLTLRMHEGATEV